MSKRDRLYLSWLDLVRVFREGDVRIWCALHGLILIMIGGVFNFGIRGLNPIYDEVFVWTGLGPAFWGVMGLIAGFGFLVVYMLLTGFLISYRYLKHATGALSFIAMVVYFRFSLAFYNVSLDAEVVTYAVLALSAGWLLYRARNDHSLINES